MFEITALKTHLFGPVSLKVKPGECVAIMGASGSGKSLFLRAIADLDPNDGDVRLDGVNRDKIGAPSWRRQVALVPAESGWWADDVATHFTPSEALADLLAAIELPDVLNWQVSRLSTGERHRLAIVRALVHRPQVLMLDEPTAALDSAATALVERLMSNHTEKGGALLLVTHDAEQAIRIATQTHIMEAGELILMTEARQ